MPSRNPLKKLEEVLKKIKTAIEPQKRLPRGISVRELESAVKTTDNIADILRKGYTSVPYNDLTMEDVQEYFGIPKSPVARPFPAWGIPVPITLVNQLDELATITNGSIENEALARARINLILQAVLRERRPFSPPQAQTMHMGFETPMGFTLTQDRVLNGKSDYTIWYSEHRDPGNQLIIVEAKKARNVTCGLPQLLGYMGTVHFSRRNAGKSNISVFGILTDAYQWDFVRLHYDGKYSLITFRWDAGQSQEIWDILNWMVACAAVQSPRGSDF